MLRLNMKKHFRTQIRLLVWGIVASIVIVSLMTGQIEAQDASPTQDTSIQQETAESVVTETPNPAALVTVTSVPEETPTESLAPPAVVNVIPISPDTPVDRSRVAVVFLIILAALMLAAIFAFVLRKENQGTREWASALLARGHVVSTVQVTAILRKDENPSIAAPPPGQPETLKIVGPTSIAASENAVYQVTDANNQAVAADVLVDWEVLPGTIPAADVQIQTGSGSFNVISSGKTGTFNLRIAAEGRTPDTFLVNVVERVADSGTRSLKAFFLGEGYGTVNLALFLIAVVAVLGTIGTIGDGTVATILGAMAGYIFGIAVAGNRSGNTSNEHA